MIRLITILSLFFFSLTVFNQTANTFNGVTNIGFPIDVRFRSVEITDSFFYESPHSKLVFVDSSVVIAAGANVQITNAGDSLFNVRELSGINYLKGDTQQVLFTGGYNVGVSIDGYGKNGDNWQVNVIHKDGSVSVSEQILRFRTVGDLESESVGRAYTMYFDFDAGDKIWLALTRITGSGDFTLIAGTFNIQLYYRKK